MTFNTLLYSIWCIGNGWKQNRMNLRSLEDIIQQQISVFLYQIARKLRIFKKCSNQRAPYTWSWMLNSLKFLLPLAFSQSDAWKSASSACTDDVFPACLSICGMKTKCRIDRFHFQCFLCNDLWGSFKLTLMSKARKAIVVFIFLVACVLSLNFAGEGTLIEFCLSNCETRKFCLVCACLSDQKVYDFILFFVNSSYFTPCFCYVEVVSFSLFIGFGSSKVKMKLIRNFNVLIIFEQSVQARMIQDYMSNTLFVSLFLLLLFHICFT